MMLRIVEHCVMMMSLILVHSQMMGLMDVEVIWSLKAKALLMKVANLNDFFFQPLCCF